MKVKKLCSILNEFLFGVDPKKHQKKSDVVLRDSDVEDIHAGWFHGFLTEY